jgi:hypothetical protein
LYAVTVSVADSDRPEAFSEVLQELRELEPLFHHPRPGMTSSDLAPMLSSDFWRVGASGVVYTRQHTLEVLDQRFNDGSPLAPWSVSEEVVRRLADQTFLYTYVLDFQGRSTRRATIWTRYGSSWRATYHQATVSSSDQYPQ